MTRRGRLRPAEPSDLERLGDIAYRTGFFGAPADPYFADAALFRDLWVRPYLLGPGCCNLVAELGGETVGYLLGACDPRAYRRYLRGPLLRHLLRRSLTGGYPKGRSSLPYLLRALRYRARHAKGYPAHLHVNLLPEARGQGLGRALLEAHLGCLRARGVSGVQLSTTRENGAALALYTSCGFRVLEAYASPLWRPWLGRDAVHVLMGRRL